MPQYPSKSAFPAVLVVASTLLLTACVGTSITQWTDHDRHLNDADMVELRVSYALCKESSWDAGVRQADLHTGRVPLVTDGDLVLGSAVPGYWAGKGAWFLGRGFARSTIIATHPLNCGSRLSADESR